MKAPLPIALVAAAAAIAVWATGSGAAQARIHCETCEYVAHFVHTHIDDAESVGEARIEHVLHHACAVLPESHREGCRTLVSHHGPHFVHMLQNGVPPGQLCERIGVCASGGHARSCRG